MNILYINHYAGSIYHGMEYRPYYLAREWVKLGHNVTIIASNISHIRTINIDVPDSQDYLVETIDGIKYIWCRTPSYSGNGVKRVINIWVFLRQVRKLFPKLIAEAKPDLVIASSTYPFDTKVAAVIAKKVQAKLVYEVHDLWPLTPIELSGMSKYHPYIWWMQKAENFAYRTADKVVSLLPKAIDYMHKHGMSLDKFVYIPNGVSISDWQNSSILMPKEHSQQIENIKGQFKFLVGYAGSMGESNALEYLVSAAKKLPDIAFVLIGNGTNRELLLQRVMNENITNVFFLSAIQKTQVADFLKQMDVLYIGWKKLSIYRFGICPNKLFDYMLAAKPIIHSVNAGNDLVFDAKCGVSVAAEDINAIVKAINTLSHQKLDDRERMGENGHGYVIKHHDYPILAKRFLVECGFINA